MTRARTASRVLAALLGSILLGAVAAAPASADDTAGISGGPSDGSGADTVRTSFAYGIEPGQMLEDSFYAKNTGTTDQQLTVFATDGYSNDAGDYAVLDTAAQPVDVGAWVSFGSESRITFTLAPGESRTLPFTVTVPANATPGDHLGGVVISAVSPSQQVLVDRRVATRLLVRVGGALQAGLNIAGVTSSYEPSLNPATGVAHVTVTLNNSGNIATAARIGLRARALFGIPLGSPLFEETDVIFPGSSRSVTFELPGVGQIGPIWAVANVTPIVDTTLPVPAGLADQSRESVFIAPPWWLIAALIVGAGVFLVLRWRRRRDAQRAQAWIEFTREQARAEAASESASAAEQLSGANR